MLMTWTIFAVTERAPAARRAGRQPGADRDREADRRCVHDLRDAGAADEVTVEVPPHL